MTEHNLKSATFTVKIATEQEFDKIYELNHEVFAAEIPQHEKQPDGRLIDSFHNKNTYIIALDDNELIGMICYNAVRPFSLDKKMDKLDSYLPAHTKLVELRLFAVKQNRRKQGVALTMLKELIPALIQQGYDLGVISASLKELELYNAIGGVPFANLVGTKEVPYQPMYFHIQNLKGIFKSSH